MRVLWSVNTLMPSVANQIGIYSAHAISWIDAMSRRLKARKDITLAIVVPINGYQKFKLEVDGNLYYLIREDADYASWARVISDFKPDIIHLYGTEKRHNLSLIREEKKVPIVISLQGILATYEKNYYAGIDLSTYLRFLTLRDFIKGGAIRSRRKMQKDAFCEREMLEKVKYVEGRTDWDRVTALDINPCLQYYFCPRLLREEFYNTQKWQKDSMVPYTIFVHQGNYPIKGLHFMLEALRILKRKYANVKLFIAGRDIFDDSTFIKKYKRSGYSIYLEEMVKKYKLENNMQFTGYLSAENLAEILVKCNVMVIPSAIENSPNSLAEAEVLGVPCVASYVGGNPEMLRDGQDGFLYCYNEPALLADKIGKIFDNPDLAQRLSESAREFALKRHDPTTLERTLLGIYENILLKEGKL